MKRKLVFIGLSFLIFLYSEAQTYEYPSPVSKSLGLSGASDTTAWAVFANPSGISGIETYIAGGGFYNGFQTKALTARSAFVVIPAQLLNSAAGYVHFGNELYNVQHFSTTFARSFSPNLKIGCRFEYVHRYIHGSNPCAAFLIDAGFSFSISDKVVLAAMADNPSRTGLKDDYSEQPLPSSLAVSCSVKLLPTFLLTTDVMHRTDFSLQTYSLGLSGQVHEWVELRGAISAKPARLAIGAGILFNRFQFNVAMNHHDHLGISSTAGVAFYLDGGEGGEF